MPTAIYADLNQYAVLGALLPWIGGVAAIFALWGSLSACRRKRLIDNLPVSKVHGVFIGLVELKGAVKCEQPLESYLTGTACVYYTYTVEERWSRTVQETVSDSRGTRVEEHTETGWTTIDSRTEMAPFYLQDETGSLLVQPEGARIEALSVLDTECTASSPLYYEKGPAMPIANSDGLRRFTESAIPLQAPIFLVGPARERRDVVAPEIAADPNGAEFLISVRSQQEVSSGLGWSIWGYFIFGALAAPGGHALSFPAAGDDFYPLAYVMFAAEFVVFIAIWLIGWLVTVYNSIVELRQRVEQGWGQVEIQLKRRHDLIPNLVDTVKGFRDHEAQTQTALAGLRSQLGATAPGQAGADFASIQSQVSILKEAYPELKADTNFLALQQELSDTEQRIALARAYFNSIATFYNTRLQVVPDRFIAALGAMKPRALMEANDFERAPVEVSFAELPKT
jgi:hypothetical protein